LQSADLELENVPVYILAGGQSRRFGSDKARAVLSGKPLVVHVVESLLRFASSVTVVADVAGKYDDLGLRTIGDWTPGLGPFGGLQAALSDSAEPWVLLAACDFPGIKGSWVEMLATADRRDAQAVAFRGDHWQPMPALYHRSVVPLIDEQARRRELSMQSLLNRARTVVIPLPRDWPCTAGVNTKAELEQHSNQ